MEILFWLVPAAVATALAIVYASWVGRERTAREPSQAELDRFAAAIMRPLPGEATRRPRSGSRERSTGVAVRRTDPDTRRSA